MEIIRFFIFSKILTLKLNISIILNDKKLRLYKNFRSSSNGKRIVSCYISLFPKNQTNL